MNTLNQDGSVSLSFKRMLSKDIVELMAFRGFGTAGRKVKLKKMVSLLRILRRYKEIDIHDMEHLVLNCHGFTSSLYEIRIVDGCVFLK